MYAWDQREEETELAYATFRKFLEMDNPRRLTVLASNEGKHVSHMRQWSAKYGWFERARLYDAYTNPMVNEEAVDAMRGVQAQIIKDGVDDYIRTRNIVLTLLDEIEQAIEKSEEGKLPIGDIIKDLKTLAQTQDTLNRQARRAVKMPTTYKSVDAEEQPEGEYLLTANGAVLIDGTTKGKSKTT